MSAKWRGYMYLLSHHYHYHTFFSKCLFVSGARSTTLLAKAWHFFPSEIWHCYKCQSNLTVLQNVSPFTMVFWNLLFPISLLADHIWIFEAQFLWVFSISPSSFSRDVQLASQLADLFIEWAFYSVKMWDLPPRVQAPVEVSKLHCPLR